MNEFSIPKAAFAGFGLMARKPAVTLVWFVFAAVYLVGVAAVGTMLAGDAFHAMSDMMASGQIDPTAMREMGRQMQPFNLVNIPVRVVASIIFAAAILRALLRPTDKGLAYLKIGGDELRLFVTLLVVVVLIGIVYIAGFIISLILGAAVGMGTGGFQSGGVAVRIGAGAGRAALSGGRLWGLLAGGAGVLVTLSALIFLSIKLSLAGPQTVGQRGIHIFESWGLTKGRFWKLFFANFLALIVLAPIAAAGLGLAIMVAKSSGAVTEWRELIGYVLYPPFSMDEFAKPARIVFYLVVTILFVLSTVVLNGVSASAYQQIAGDEAVAGAPDDDDDEDWDD